MSKRLPFISPLYSTSFFQNTLLKIFSIKIIFSITLLSLLIISQTSIASVPEEKWNLYKEINGVKIYTSKEECHDFANGTHYEYVMLKFENTTNITKKISWSEHLYYNGICSGCDGNTDRSLYQIELKANETTQGGCGTDDGDTFRIFNRFLNYVDKPVLTKYDLVNLIVIDR